MKKLKIVCSITIAVAILCLFIVDLYPFELFFSNIKWAITYPNSFPEQTAKAIFITAFYCLCALIVLATLIFLLIVLWKSDLAILMESIAEKDKAKRKAAKQAKLQREIAEKTAQLEELNNQPSGEENGE